MPLNLDESTGADNSSALDLWNCDNMVTDIGSPSLPQQKRSDGRSESPGETEARSTAPADPEIASGAVASPTARWFDAVNDQNIEEVQRLLTEQRVHVDIQDAVSAHAQQSIPCMYCVKAAWVYPKDFIPI